jgi:hypothetical protein
MNRKLGFYASAIVTITVVLFATGILTGSSNLSYSVCLVLTWGYILTVCGFIPEVAVDKKALAYGSLAFACLYGVLIDIVYFTQLTTVLNLTASEEVLKVVSYQSLGSLFFNLNLFGYGMMAVSTFLIGLALTPADRADKALKALLMIHGIFLFPCVLFPVLNVFNAGMRNGGVDIGSVVLLFWCAYFTPVGILSALHFKRAKA